jgi:hypothetical protein
MTKWEYDCLMELLKSPDYGARLSIDDRWLYWEQNNSLTNSGQWKVNSRPPYKKNVRCLYSGDQIIEALNALKDDD